MAAAPAAEDAVPSLQPLQYVPFASAPDVGFWRELGRRKLDDIGLDDAPLPVRGWFEVTAHGRTACQLFIDGTAFTTDAPAPPGAFGVHGTLVNTNTLEEFKRADKNALMERAARELREELGKSPPTRLTRVIVLSYADLKAHEYYYWFGFPALAPAVPFAGTPMMRLEDALAPLSLDPLRAAHRREAIGAGGELSFFALRVHVRGLGVRGGGVGGASEVHGEERAFELAPLSSWVAWCDAAASGDAPTPMLCFADPTVDPAHAGWPLRTLLMWARSQPGAPQYVQVVCWREPLELRPPSAAGPAPPSRSLTLRVRLLPDAESGVSTASLPMAVGWERNARGKLGARVVSLRAQLDPIALAEASVDLNLRLMRWRLLPELDTARLARTRCLLIGAGTLGCNVARALLAWGVRTITFVDGGSVSHSNPVRQSLFTYHDCVGDERRAKAVAAAEAVGCIFPGARSRGVELLVPMPGHPPADAEVEAVREAVEQLEGLVEEHDAVFLLTDTRESRWLPSLLCAAKDKIAITAALGFDSYVVMRHGRGPSQGSQPAGAAGPEGGGEGGGGDEEARLGCYFCNDVVAPVDSTRDRTLDQQCTVTRPGLSMVASSLAVELLVTISHHAQGHGAPADGPGGEPSTPLGLLPHQVRGFLPSFRTELLRGQAFACCVACSARAVHGYRQGGFAFCLRAFREPDFLEEFSGLRELQRGAEAALEAWEGDEEDEDDDGELNEDDDGP